MKIVIAGGSGFLGRPLAARLALSGHEVVILTRSLALGRAAGGLRYASWEPAGAPSDAGEGTEPSASSESFRGGWTAELNGADAVVNLSGADIADQRWTKGRKRELRDSRISSTRTLIGAMRNVRHPPGMFLQQSAVGYYGSTGEAIADESSGPGSDFLARLCVEWEAESHAAHQMGCRLVVVRTGVVLSGEGGALPKMLPPFRLFVGGRISSGRQYMSWIHLNDWVSMMAWAIETPEVSGVINATAPKPVPNRIFSRAIGRAIHRPSLMPVPGAVLRLIFGEMADVVLINGQRVLPRRALELKFGFRYPDVDLALKAALAPD